MKIPEITTALEARQLIAAGHDWLKAHGRSWDETLASPGIKQEIAELKEHIKADPEVGAKLLRDAGIWDENNKLTKKFGG